MNFKKRYVIVRHGFIEDESFIKFSIYFKHETKISFKEEDKRNEFATKFRFKWIAQKVCNFLNFTNNNLLIQYMIREIKT